MPAGDCGFYRFPGPAMAPPDHPRTCIHCGTPFEARGEETEFCCNGCRYVYHLIHNKGLDRFYELKDKTVPPVPSRVFHESDFHWLEELIRAQSEQDTAEIELQVQGISCVGCVWLIERIFSKAGGGLFIRVLANQGRVLIRWKPSQLDLISFAKELETFGYRLGPDLEETRRRRSPLLTRLGICAALAMNAMLFTLPFYLGMSPDDDLAGLFGWLTFLMATASILVGGTYFFKRSWRSLLLKEIHIDLPISIGLLAAFGGSLAGWVLGETTLLYFDFVTIFTALMLLGRFLQEQAIEKNRRAVLSTSTLSERWTVLRNEEILQLAMEQIEPGDILMVRPGQVVPVQGRLEKSSAMIGLDWITGEGQPFLYKPGAHLPAGAINVSASPIQVASLQTWNDSPLKELIQVSEQAFSPSAQLEQVIRIYILAVIGIAFLGSGIWWATGAGLAKAVQVGVSILVVSCPCAIGIALPLADELAIRMARAAGVFVRSGSLWHRLTRIRNLAFDKTGTVTLETPGLTNPDELEALSHEERGILWKMVSVSPHPASRAIRETLARLNPGLSADPGDGHVLETPGDGLEYTDGKTVWRLGRPAWASPLAPVPVGCRSSFSRDHLPLAHLSFQEEIRFDAATEIKQLKQRGLSVYLLSGDKPENVQRMAALIDIPLAHGVGGRRPEEKAAWIREHQADTCLMIGDGANDSLAFGEAGCTGTPAVGGGILESKADFFFLGQNLRGIRKLLETSDRRRTAIRRLMAFTISYNLLAVGLALAGGMSPLVAAVIMPLSSITSLLLCSLTFRGSQRNRGRR